MVKRIHSGGDSEEEKPSKTLLLESTGSMDNVADKKENKNVRSFYGSKPRDLRWASSSVKINHFAESPNKNIHEDEKLPKKTATPKKQHQQQQQRNSKKPKTPQQQSKKVISEDKTGDKNQGEDDDEKTFPPAPAVKRYYKRDVFWTSNVYGKKRKREKKQSEDANYQKSWPKVESKYTNNQESTPKVGTLKDTNIPASSPKVKTKDGATIPTASPKAENHKKLMNPPQNVSIETQTSFSSSQDSSSIGTKSPVMSATSSPFVGGECVSETTTSQQLSQDENILITEEDGNEEEEHYEMFSLDTSESCANDRKSDSSCNVSPVKKTPKKRSQEKKTLLNYFSKLQQSDNMKLMKCTVPADKMKSPSPHSLSAKKRSQRQMQFSKTGLSPKVEVGFVIYIFIIPIYLFKILNRLRKL